jgi:threonine aldolase
MKPSSDRQSSSDGPVDFRSDNVATAAPEILAAIADANRGTATAYGGDELSRRLDARFSELFETPVRVFPVATGTAANALSLASITPSWGAVYCSEVAHAHTSEAGATEFFSGGAKLVPLPGENFKISVSALERALADAGVGQTHRSQPAAVTFTQATEYGTLYSPDDLSALCSIARRHGVSIHMDGARFANAVAALGTTPAAITWRLGVDVMSFGATKNGALLCDAIVVFRPELAAELPFRLRRSGQVWSKMRFAAVQLLAYVESGLWLRLAARANALAARLGGGIGTLPSARLVAPVEANEVFVELPEQAIENLASLGLLFHRRGSKVIRLVCRFDGTEQEVDRGLDMFRRTLT